MEIRGNYQNGIIVPQGGLSLPEGTEVTITLSSARQPNGQIMSQDERKRYLEALGRIDAIPDESPTDTFSGVDHDRELYGNHS